ncbi:MAG: hypothetical protein ABUT20_26805 [Bacteroidota bacterium]
MMLAAGIAALICDKGKNVAKGWLDIALPLPTIAKRLIYTKHPIAGIALGAIDVVCDAGAFISGFYLSGPNSSPGLEKTSWYGNVMQGIKRFPA